MMKLCFFLMLIISNTYAYDCRISYKGPKLSPGGQCLEQPATLEECRKFAKATFNGIPTVTQYRFSKSLQAVIFETIDSQYSQVAWTYQDGDTATGDTLRRKRSSVVLKVKKWSRSCDVRSCLKDPDEDSCQNECKLDVGYRPGLDVDLER